MGETSFNISVAEIKQRRVKILASCANGMVGGRDFDTVIFDFFMEQVKEIEEENGIELEYN